MVLQLAAGLALGALLILFARWRGQHHEHRVFAIGLVMLPLIYIGFAFVGEAPADWIALEASGILPFGLLAWLGRRRLSLGLAIGWATHVLWDAGLHLGPQAPTFVPKWYVVLCISFDLLVAGYIAARTRAARSPRPEAA